MNFDEYKKHHNKFNETLNTAPHFYFLKLAEEVGEVMEITAAINGSKRKLAKLGGTENIKNKLIEELGDVICVALTCAYQYDITPEELFAANAEKLVERMAAKKEEATAPRKNFDFPISQEFTELKYQTGDCPSCGAILSSIAHIEQCKLAVENWDGRFSP